MGKFAELHAQMVDAGYDPGYSDYLEQEHQKLVALLREGYSAGCFADALKYKVAEVLKQNPEPKEWK